MTMIERLRALRAAAVAKLADLRDEADTLATSDAFDETRASTVLAEIRATNSQIDELDPQIADLEAVEQRAENAASVQFARQPDDPTAVADVARLSDGDARSRAVTMVERNRNFVDDTHRENVTRLIEQRGSVGAAAARLALVTGSELYERAWTKAMTGNEMAMDQEERAALARGRDVVQPGEGMFGDERAMTGGTGSSGGFFVPVVIDPTMIITGAGSYNPLREIATVKQIGPAFGGWYGATAAQVTAAWTAENTAAPDNTPTISQPNIPVYMALASVTVSFPAYEDIADLAADVVALFSDAKANLETIAFTTGDGSAKPTGVSFAVGAVTASRVAATTGGSYGIVDTYNVHNSLPPRFWRSQNRGWLAHVKVTDETRRLAMAQNSANSVWTDMAGGTPPQLLGDPVLLNSSMSNSLTTGQDVLLYGDFSRFYIIDRIGFATEFIPNLFNSSGLPTAQRAWIAHWRTGSNVVDANAFRQLRL